MKAIGNDLVGTWRRFGEIGPVYEIIRAGKVSPDGRRFMRIKVLESDEEVDYPLADILEDPLEYPREL
ncbi:MAG: DUF5397 family protein [Nitrospirae bacterium]|uniref:DUF5397 family protein n=1 Tax=Candidatus Magnetobacterium casense TaxID=1455061 RepID=UPI000590206A|nr:DUF5397 family protein [Candidatus Magnetobacterium casensis]MBF0336573.1 DUF5397 family protein [Nitrospirota bacterium]